ncbi:hypothetical protein DFS34DRAFT_691190 [Phlyctochytrium arcticum]|nr:hypothetical protein DFS34DRAFT_691190 [Phlyctochytrium arcticum]
MSLKSGFPANPALPKEIPKCAVHPPRGWDEGKSFKVLRGSNSPPAEAELVPTDFRGLYSLSGDAERQMIPYAVHPPRGCDEGKSFKMLRGSDATSPPAEAEQATCRKYLGQMIPCAVHPPRGCDKGKSYKLLRGRVMSILLPPSRSRLRAENILGDADRPMVHSSKLEGLFLHLGSQSPISSFPPSLRSHTLYHHPSSPATFVGSTIACVSTTCFGTTSSFASDVLEVVLSTIIAFAHASSPSFVTRYFRRLNNSVRFDNVFRHHFTLCL